MALKILGKDLSFIKQRAICYRLVQDYDRALADYNDAIELDPKNADLLYQRSRVWMRKNDQVRRLADIADALKIEPGNVTFQTAFMEASGKSIVIFVCLSSITASLFVCLFDRFHIIYFKSQISTTTQKIPLLREQNSKHRAFSQRLLLRMRNT